MILLALDVFGDLFNKEELNEHKILQSLLTSDKHLNMKTRVREPIALAVFDVSALRFKNKKMKRCANLILNFSRYYKEFKVSYPDGEGRKEITDALASIRQNKTGQSLAQRLLGKESI